MPYPSPYNALEENYFYRRQPLSRTPLLIREGLDGGNQLVPELREYYRGQPVPYQLSVAGLDQILINTNPPDPADDRTTQVVIRAPDYQRLTIIFPRGYYLKGPLGTPALTLIDSEGNPKTVTGSWAYENPYMVTFYADESLLMLPKDTPPSILHRFPFISATLSAPAGWAQYSSATPIPLSGWSYSGVDLAALSRINPWADLVLQDSSPIPAVPSVIAAYTISKGTNATTNIRAQHPYVILFFDCQIDTHSEFYDCMVNSSFSGRASTSRSITSWDNIPTEPSWWNTHGGGVEGTTWDYFCRHIESDMPKPSWWDRAVTQVLTSPTYNRGWDSFLVNRTTWNSDFGYAWDNPSYTSRVMARKRFAHKNMLILEFFSLTLQTAYTETLYIGPNNGVRNALGGELASTTVNLTVLDDAIGVELENPRIMEESYWDRGHPLGERFIDTNANNIVENRAYIPFVANNPFSDPDFDYLNGTIISSIAQVGGAAKAVSTLSAQCKLVPYHEEVGTEGPYGVIHPHSVNTMLNNTCGFRGIVQSGQFNKNSIFCRHVVVLEVAAVEMVNLSPSIPVTGYLDNYAEVLRFKAPYLEAGQSLVVTPLGQSDFTTRGGAPLWFERLNKLGLGAGPFQNSSPVQTSVYLNSTQRFVVFNSASDNQIAEVSRSGLDPIAAGAPNQTPYQFTKELALVLPHFIVEDPVNTPGSWTELGVQVGDVVYLLCEEAPFKVKSEQGNWPLAIHSFPNLPITSSVTLSDNFSINNSGASYVATAPNNYLNNVPIQTESVVDSEVVLQIFAIPGFDTLDFKRIIMANNKDYLTPPATVGSATIRLYRCEVKHTDKQQNIYFVDEVSPSYYGGGGSPATYLNYVPNATWTLLQTIEATANVVHTGGVQDLDPYSLPPAWSSYYYYNVGYQVLGYDYIAYNCIADHYSDFASQPPYGPDWELYWEVAPPDRHTIWFELAASFDANLLGLSNGKNYTYIITIDYANLDTELGEVDRDLQNTYYYDPYLPSPRPNLSRAAQATFLNTTLDESKLGYPHPVAGLGPDNTACNLPQVSNTLTYLPF